MILAKKVGEALQTKTNGRNWSNNHWYSVHRSPSEYTMAITWRSTPGSKPGRNGVHRKR